MDEQWIARLWDAVRTETLTFSRHYTIQLFVREQPGESDVEFVLCDDEPRVIEHYQARPNPETGRGSCLILGQVNDRPVHVNCSYPPDPVVITAYWPDTRPDEWTEDYGRRASS